jgi:fucose 4-O-acetylase-like acetyltransferase
MAFAWYIRFYLVVLLLLPFLAVLMDTQGKASRLVVLIFCLLALYVSLVISGHENDAYWLPCVISGYACAQYKVIERCVGCMILLKIGLVIGVVAVVASCYLYRYFGYVLKGAFNAGALYAPFFCCGWIILYPYVQKIKIAGFLQILGKHSLNIWLLHGIFFSIPTRASFQRFAYAVDSPFYVLPFVVGVCLIASMLIKPLQKVCRRIIVEKMAGF